MFHNSPSNDTLTRTKSSHFKNGGQGREIFFRLWGPQTADMNSGKIAGFGWDSSIQAAGKQLPF